MKKKELRREKYISGLSEFNLKESYLMEVDTPSIDGNYRVITLIFKKYDNLPLCLENYALFSLPPILQIFHIHIH